ncbi:MAG: RNA methyltransferase [Betaproteobacteria bacterium RIFCSPLOWO2_12_FULL_62_13]|nr:MAG: RNA methyltransferase [Betaproteobacteria bacterium RIFCSPLOWO2_12_FULL_62_13]
MNASRFSRQSLLTLFLTVAAAAVFAQAQPARNEYEPQVGQEGKDVVWVPTPQALVDKMLDMAKVTPADYVIDLGSGDGRTVITAAKRGARALGIEYNPDMVELSKRNAATEGVSDKARFAKADLFESDFSQATVITMFLLPDINLKLRPTILNLKPGTRIVSNSFTMGDWKADRTETVSDGCTSYCTALLWIVPAKAGGTWQLPQGELTLKQEFQMVSGTLKSGATTLQITNGRLRGDQISFNAGGARYTGRVTGNTIEGTVKSGGNASRWSATRVRKLSMLDSWSRSRPEGVGRVAASAAA